MIKVLEKFKTKQNKEKIICIIKSIIILVLPIIIEVLFYKNHSLIINKISILRLGFMYGLIAFYYLYKICSVYTNNLKAFLEKVFKYRYLIGLITFLVMIAMKVNISNIGCWSLYIPSEDSMVIGKTNPIRSDEWKVQLPFFFAQGMNKEAYYPLNNQNIGEGQNMLMVYPAPALDLTLIGKPQNLGFFILGRDYGFSWYTCMRFIMLALLSIEIVLIITNGDKLLSLIGGLWVAFSPTIMWWLSSNGDIYIHAFAIIVLFHYFVNNPQWKLWKKLLIGLGIISSIPGFVFCFYPPVQIPLAYAILAFVLVDYLKKIKTLKLRDYAIMIASVIIAVAIVGYYLYVSMDEISLIMNTVYPGSRDLVGGDYKVKHAIEYFFDIFTPFNGKNLEELGQNKSEAAASIIPIIGIFIGIIYSLRDFKEKIKDKKNWLFYALVLVYFVYIIWMYIGFGKVLSKVSLFFMCQPERVALLFGLVGMFLTIMIISRKEIKLEKLQAIIISLLVLIISNIAISSVAGYSQYFDVTKKLILYSVIFLMTYSLLTLNKKLSSLVLVSLTISTGMFITPLNIGTNAIFNTDTAREIQKYVENDPSKIWIGNSSMDAQYAIANGAKVLNGINYYPNFKMLNTLDETGKYNEVYNRYAHIEVHLSEDEETDFELIQPDMYIINISKSDFDKLGISYYYSATEIDEEMLDEFNLNNVYSNPKEGKFIYEVI